METKANPGPHACFNRALADEPMFILLGRDRAAPDAIRAWVEARNRLGLDTDQEQLLEAFKDSDRFREWREANDGRWRTEVPPRADLIPTPTDETSSAAGRILASDPFGSRKLVRQLSQKLADAGIGRIVRDNDGPTDTAISEALQEVFGGFYRDAKTLAGFAMRSDTTKGSNDADSA